MYCRHCGKKINDDSKFCRYCSSNVEEIETKDIKEDIKQKEISEIPNYNIIIHYETDRQTFGIRIIYIISIFFYLSCISSGISFYLQDEYLDAPLMILNILIFGGSIFLSSLALYAYNRKRFYTLPVLRAALALFSFWIGFIPFGWIIIVIFWRRLSLPIIKKYLSSELSSEDINYKLPKKEIKSFETKRINFKKIKKKKLFAIIIPIVIAFLYFLTGLIYFGYAGRQYDQNQYLVSAYNYKIASLFLIPNSNNNKNLALDKDYRNIVSLILDDQCSTAYKKIGLLKSFFPDYDNIEALDQLYSKNCSE
jgi:hypothetical protein